MTYNKLLFSLFDPSFVDIFRFESECDVIICPEQSVEDLVIFYEAFNVAPIPTTSETSLQEYDFDSQILTESTSDDSRETVQHCCEFCDKTFGKRYLLTKHMKVHASLNFECCMPLCGKSFKTKEGLSRHVASRHCPNPKATVCSACNKSFTQKSSYYRHLKEVHASINNYTCPNCDKEFNRRDHQRRHYKSCVNRVIK